MPTKPIRVSQELFEQATRAGRLHHRSATRQLEYWADLGRGVERHIDPVDVLRVTSGAAKIVVKALASRPVRTAEVLGGLNALREAGALSGAVSGAPIRYAASATHPGYLERVGRDGRAVVGRFVDGEFVPGL